MYRLKMIVERVLHLFFHMAEGQILTIQFLRVLDREYLGHPDAYTGDTKALAEALEIWYYEYRRQWHKISRESELYRIW